MPHCNSSQFVSSPLYWSGSASRVDAEFVAANASNYSREILSLAIKTRARRRQPTSLLPLLLLLLLLRRTIA